jgi:ribosomal protein L11 methylase PrmA
MTNYQLHPASFKDPSGFIFQSNGIIYRQVNKSYAAAYDLLMSSGLYNKLTQKKQLIAHQEVPENMTGAGNWYKTLQPEQIPHISYPYEWCFEQLRDAALLTLSVLRTALNHGMILKDATPFNIQFIQGRPVFIDTLSFDTYDPAQPWVAYRQFCQCFLFPLYLEHYLKKDVQKILSAYIDGIPVDVTARLLPWKSNLSLGVWLHVYLQNTVQRNKKGSPANTVQFQKKKLLDLISHLESILQRFPAERTYKTTWNNYYDDTILSQEYLQEKEDIFRRFCEGMAPQTVLDLGANDGYFSKILAGKGAQVVATDVDGQCINRLYGEIKNKHLTNLLPLILDISNPSPAVGFHNREREAFHQRIQADLVLALALVHHLVIGKNIPLPMLAAYFNDIAPQLIIEFVPREDEKVKQMLASREDVFQDYTEAQFEASFLSYFELVNKQTIPGTPRILYHLQRRKTAR